MLKMRRIDPIPGWLVRSPLPQALLGFLCCLSPCQAAGSEAKVIDLNPLIIEESGTSLPPGTLFIEEADPQLPVPMAEHLSQFPGVSLNARGTFSGEPMIRGLGFDRVVTRFNGLILPNGSPTRTQSPVNAFGSLSGRSVVIRAALPSLTEGQPRTGGAIEISDKAASMVRHRPDGTDASSARLAWIPARDGFQGMVTYGLADNAFSLRVGVHGNELGDYSSADGRTVPSSFRDRGISLRSWFAQTKGLSHAFDGFYHDQGFTENASLPLDTITSSLYALTGVHRVFCSDNPGSVFRIRYGFARSEAELSNLRREQRPLSVVTETEAESGHVDAGWQAGTSDGTRFSLGFEGNREQRRAIRHRGESGLDYIWPGVENRHAGLYAQSHWRYGDSFKARVGIRWDYAHSRARDADKTAFGRPIEDLYAAFSELPGDADEATDRGFSANALLQWIASEDVSFHAGLGSSIQSPAPTERYRAFLNALGGGFEVGNPGLSPERKREFILGTNLRHQRGFIRVDAFHYRINRFVWREPVGTTEGLLPLVPPQTVFSYRNVDACFTGLEIQGSWNLNASIQIPFSLEWIEAELRESGPGYNKGDSLPELPPARIQLGARWTRALQQGSLVVEWTLEAAETRQNPLPGINPIYGDSDSFTLHHLGISLFPAWGGTISLQVRNLLDEHYTPYLSPPVSSIPPASGDLRPGDRVPGPGREVILSLKMPF